jgi:hypothetical protein
LFFSVSREAIINDEGPNSPKMRFHINLLSLCFALVGVNTQTVQDGCPKNEYACLDVINSSQCIEELVIEHDSPLTKDAMVKCVEYNGTATNLPGATKVSFQGEKRFDGMRYRKNVRLINV